MSIKVEVFTSPGCAKCLESVAALKAFAESIAGGNISWRVVDLLKEMDYAVDLGVLSAPAIAIDGELVFPTLPKAGKLQTELARRLKQAGA